MSSLDELISRLEPSGWFLMGALALEGALSRDVLAKLALFDEKEADVNGLTAFLEATGSRGWITEDRRAVSLAGDAVQPVLRALTRRGLIDAVAQRCHELLGYRSRAAPSVALQTGNLKAFRQLATAIRVSQTDMDEWLYQHVCCPFDAEWFEATWGERALEVGHRALELTLISFTADGGLAPWLRRRARALPSNTQKESLTSLLVEQALLCGDLDTAYRELVTLPELPRAAHEAVALFIAGDLPHANEALAAVLRKRSSKLPYAGAVAPILALLSCATGPGERRQDDAKRLLNRSKDAAAKKHAAAFRKLLAHLTEPASALPRLDAYQTARSGTAWELMLLGLAVELQVQDAVTRAAWAQQLARRGLAWRTAGFAWVGKQALLLAAELDRERCLDELEACGVPTSELTTKPRELVLWHCIVAKPDWQKALDRLSEVSEQIGCRVERQYRVAWYVDMARGCLARPALQRFREDLGTWSQGDRLGFEELAEQRELLPPEDQRVLDYPPDARLEALIEHPRVYDGARGGVPVQVERGTARIETRSDVGHIQVIVEPAGAQAGINVSVEAPDRLRVYRVDVDLARVIAALPHGVRIPREHENEVLEVLGKLSQSVTVHSPELGLEREVQADTSPCLRFSLHSGAWLVQLGVRPLGARGRFFIAGEGQRLLRTFKDGRRQRCERKLKAERHQVDALIAQCPTLASNRAHPEDADPLDAHDSWVLGEEGVLELLSELEQAPTRHHLEWPESGGLKLRGSANSSSLDAQLRCIKGWYIASGSVRVGDFNRLSLQDLVRAQPLTQGRFVRLEDGDYVELGTRLGRVIAALRGAPAEGDGICLHRGARAALAELAQTEGFELDAESQAWIERAERISEQEVPQPQGLQTELRHYQQAGLAWLWRMAELGLGACLADDMGLGKTIQIIALLLVRTSSSEKRGAHNLIVAPTSVCGNWMAELERFAPAMPVFEFVEKGQGEALSDALADALARGASLAVVTSYALLQQNRAIFERVAWDTVVLDEAQLIKNPTSLRARAAFALKAQNRIASTGTPVENHLGDLWSIFRFLNPGLLGEWSDFRRRYVRPIEQNDDEEVRAELKRRLEGFVLRRVKQEVLSELPPLTQVNYEIPFSEDETVRYTLLRKQIHERLFTSERRHTKLEVLTEITRLRRFCCHPMLVFPNADPRCEKVDAFLELAEELRDNGHRALVFSQFVDFLSLVRDQLEERGVAYEYLDGSTPKAQRRMRVDSFQNGAATLFLISLKAGGFGLNLTAADYVVHLDPWWNPAVEAQATDRAYRIGQHKPVTVYRLLMKDSIEQDIVRLHVKKRELANNLLDRSDRASQVDVDELLELLAKR